MRGLQFKRKLKVLIAEDNVSNQALMRIYVKSFGGIPHIAANGKEAVQEFMEQDFDVVLMDIDMPVLDGFNATSQIRSKNKKVPIIAVTVYDDTEYIKKSKQIGMNDYIAKPYPRQELFRAIQQSVGMS